MPSPGVPAVSSFSNFTQVSPVWAALLWHYIMYLPATFPCDIIAQVHIGTLNGFVYTFTYWLATCLSSSMEKYRDLPGILCYS